VSQFNHSQSHFDHMVSRSNCYNAAELPWVPLWIISIEILNSN